LSAGTRASIPWDSIPPGLTTATDASGHIHLYATNFRADTVEIYNPISPARAFTDQELTAPSLKFWPPN
jgi:hypothetical protein